jgi:hypothetical protein
MVTDKLKEVAGRVVDSHKRFSSAVEDKRAGEAKLLTQILEQVRGSLPAICSPVKMDSKNWFPNQGVLVCYEKPSRRAGLEVKIPTREIGLNLWEDEGFSLVSVSETADGRIYHEQRLSYDEVVGAYDVEKIAEGLMRILTAHATGHKDQRTEIIMARVEKIKAVITLLES